MNENRHTNVSDEEVDGKNDKYRPCQYSVPLFHSPYNYEMGNPKRDANRPEKNCLNHKGYEGFEPSISSI